MAQSVYPTPSSGASYPIPNATLVYSGYTSKGAYTYTTSTAAGDYLFYLLPADSSAKIVVVAPNSNISYYASGPYVPLHTTTTETAIKFYTFGKYGLWSNITSAGIVSAGGVGMPTRNRALGYNNGNFWFYESGNYWVVYSTNNGVTWSTAAPAYTNPYGCYSALYDGTGYWAGYYDAAIYSTNLTSWSNRSISGVNSVLGLAYQSGASSPWVACGNGGIYYSANGTSWTSAGIGANMNDLISTGTYFVSTGSWDTTNNRVPLYYSTNGSSWSVVSLNNVFGTSTNSIAQYIAYGNGIYVAGGGNYSGTVNTPTIAYSTNLTTWTTSLGLATSGVSITSLKFGGGLFQASVQNTSATPTVYSMYTSVDGKSWSSSTIDGLGGTPYCLTPSSDGTKTYFIGGGNSNSKPMWYNIDIPTEAYMYSLSGQSALN
jgi:hypothetical protein